ncbi:MAG TPA: hypothetical protein VFG10_14435 [Saprospiraceae bacterium]|nr:hypothetical protein [Saprospiraceae bacterium]
MKNHFLFMFLLFSAGVISMSCNKDEDNPQVLTASGDIQATLDEYRSLLGTNNGGSAGPQTSGRREISWDGVPDSLASPYFLPHDFFKARGADFTTPGDGVQVSADASNPSGALPSFGNINPTYQQIFPAFSAERLFSPTGSNVVNLRFYVPGTTTPAVTRGFGAIYVDVDKEENTAFEYFDINDHSLGTYATPSKNEGFVFLGVLFNSPVVHRVRIEYGNSELGPNDGGSVDVSVMDDFIFGEPQEP